ncbi:hypothetical protein Ahy_A02g009463 [Arachis hypogaea]|uniref:Uncharacterized protein n=1 Tax=Arachis hypogaea TaxID=3818 RepID=A0A445EH62_ARAHY|nr:hypothetical protein Ahy_A02g009463 [Arachis hypogaea]
MDEILSLILQGQGEMQRETLEFMATLTKKMCEKNAVNREKQTISHTLRSKMIARKKHELEIANKRIFTKIEMYLISHKKNYGSFVNDGAREKKHLALLQANESSPNDDAYIKLFGKEHPDRVRCVGFGVSSSYNHDFDMTKVCSVKVELQENKATILLLQGQVTYFVNHCMDKKVAELPMEKRPPSTIP